MRPIAPLYSEASSSPKPPSKILPPKGKKAVRRWERTGKPKSRSGCGTCKIRRVKCDETRPICTRCAKGKFDCDGYSSDTPGEASDSTDLSCDSVSSAGDVSASPGTPATTLDLIPSPESDHSQPCIWHESPSSILPVTSAYNPIYVEHFNQNTNLSNALFSYSDVYSSIVLQETLQDECIQNAVLALGSLFYSGFALSQNGVQIETANHHRHQSLQLYNAALHAFRKRMQSTTSITSRWMALMTPLLAMYELLQGDFNAADQLLSSAMEALRSSGDVSHISASESSGIFSYTSLQIIGDTTPLFTMTSKQCCYPDLQCDSTVILQSGLLAPVAGDTSFSEGYSGDMLHELSILDSDYSWMG
ncbi:transcriptional regulatory [Fusarium sp. NRRL 52700]|nr:transcriptional regulatory [Fusarium sp. NRRL 52700]